MKTQKLIKRLNKKLEDVDYRRAWTANIAMSFIDNERWYMEEYNKKRSDLDDSDVHAIANMAAVNFLSLLSK